MTHDRDRFSLIGHAALPFMSPLDEAEMRWLAGAAEVTTGARVLDVGGGRGDLAVLLAQTFGARVLTIDRSPAACEQARARTHGLDVEVECLDGVDFVRSTAPERFALACSVGAIHAFGSGLEGWKSAEAALRRVATRVWLADLVALGPKAESAFEVASWDALGLATRSRAHRLLPPSRVHDYETAWSNGLAQHLEAHPDDPRGDWARQRIAWTSEPSLREARAELAFAAFVL